jgi:DNA-directed RNA polymerase III subunit RPC6
MDDEKQSLPRTPDEIEASVYRVCSSVSGITQGRILEMIPNITIEELARCVDRLLRDGKLNYFHDQELGTIKYFSRTEDQVAKFQGLGQEEMVLYQLIKVEGRMGIWTRNLKIRSGFTQVRIRKIITTLESRKLIKSVKSITAKNRKMYMLSELEPDPSHYGGPWYSDSDFDSEFFKVLADSCHRQICKAGCITAEDLCMYIKQTNISKVELSVDNVHTIINTLIYDGLVEEVVDPSFKRKRIATDSTTYRPSRLQLPTNELMNVPCGMCPVAHLCAPMGDITPEKCVYLTDWLSSW